MHTDQLILRASEDPKFLQRFQSNVRRGDGCWEWTGSLRCDGYGQGRVATGRKPGRVTAAHRVAWIISNKRETGGLHVLHTCDNRRCVNPAHLYLGTDADNHRDMIARGRSPRGEAHKKSKLREAQVRQIKALRGVVSMRDLGVRFGVSDATIHSIYSGRSWAHVK